MNSQFHFVQTSIYTSCDVKRVAVGHCKYKMSYGNKISVSLAIGATQRLEYQTNTVSDMTDLIGDLRIRAKEICGLAIVTIRNHDQGWIRQQEIMLYPERRYVPSERVISVRKHTMMPWQH